ncbi:hypothetical protein [Actinospica robiniae]|uniref:hypothetical protein n=1 Tax=Actinospica robiniae TaxID=304901 RepID=UPI0006872250|nr:hypothetical protein [Actinospica robiniae]
MRRTAGESLIRGRIEWYLEVHCAHCGFNTIECGSDNPPEPIRSMLLEQTGTWLATVDSAPAIAAMRVLRKVYGATLAEARELSDRLGTSGLAGTHGEVLYLQHQLAALGIDATVEPGPTAPR